MKELLSKSIQILNTNVLLVLFIGICNIQILSGVLTYISLLGLVVSFVLSIIVYGRLVANIQGNTDIPAKLIFKENWLNYIVAIILLGIPILLFSQLVKVLSTSAEILVFGKEGFRMLVNILAIYVLPIVFIKKQHVLAIMAGIIFFFQNFKKSIPLIMLAVFMFIIHATTMWLVVTWQLQLNQNIHALIPVMVLVNIAVTYLSFLVFTTACLILIPSPLEEVEHVA